MRRWGRRGDGRRARPAHVDPWRVRKAAVIELSSAVVPLCCGYGRDSVMDAEVLRSGNELRPGHALPEACIRVVRSPASPHLSG